MDFGPLWVPFGLHVAFLFAPKTTPKLINKSTQNLDCLKMPPQPPEDLLRSSQDHPRSPQDRPQGPLSSAQEVPRSTQEAHSIYTFFLFSQVFPKHIARKCLFLFESLKSSKTFRKKTQTTIYIYASHSPWSFAMDKSHSQRSNTRGWRRWSHEALFNND